MVEYRSKRDGALMHSYNKCVLHVKIHAFVYKHLGVNSNLISTMFIIPMV